MKTVAPLPLKMWVLGVALFVLTVIGAKVYTNSINLQPSTETERELPIYGKIANFELVERSGSAYNLDRLKGKVWIADFIFSRCAGVCNLMSGEMALLQNTFKKSQGIKLVSFSVDPEYDSPEVLSRYAKKYSADQEDWLFLTGDKESIFNLSEQHFLLGVQDIPMDERLSEDQIIRHSSKFVLVDQTGKIRGYYDSSSKQNLDQLAQDAFMLLGL